MHLSHSSLFNIIAIRRGPLRGVQGDGGPGAHGEAGHGGALHAVAAAGRAARRGKQEAAQARQQLQGTKKGDPAKGGTQVSKYFEHLIFFFYLFSGAVEVGTWSP